MVGEFKENGVDVDGSCASKEDREGLRKSLTVCAERTNTAGNVISEEKPGERGLGHKGTMKALEGGCDLDPTALLVAQ